MATTHTIHPEKEYCAHLEAGRFMIQRSKSTGRFFFYPRVAEPVTGERDLEWVAASGRGVVYSTTTIRPKPPAVPYNVVLVDLEEGPRLMSRVEGLPAADVKIGMKVKAFVGKQDDRAILLFELDEATDGGGRT